MDKINIVDLSSINQQQTPSQKIKCILSACQTLYGRCPTPPFDRIGIISTQGGADDLLPLLIYTIVKSNPANIYSNISYPLLHQSSSHRSSSPSLTSFTFIEKFRNQNRMASEGGYYFTQFLSAVSYLEALVPEQLALGPEEFSR